MGSIWNLIFFFFLISESITERIYDHVCVDLRKSIELAEKCEMSANRMFSTNFSVKVNGMGEMYNRFAMFCQQYYGIDTTDELPMDAERNILVAVLRGMKFGSKNSRLQFPRILQLPNLMNMRLAEDFDKEVRDGIIPLPRISQFSWCISI